MLALYGHPFSSYTWKAQIALHALGLDYDFRVLDAEHPEHGAFVQQHVVDGEVVLAPEKGVSINENIPLVIGRGWRD